MQAMLNMALVAVLLALYSTITTATPIAMAKQRTPIAVAKQSYDDTGVADIDVNKVGGTAAATLTGSMIVVVAGKHSNGTKLVVPVTDEGLLRVETSIASATVAHDGTNGVNLRADTGGVLAVMSPDIVESMGLGETTSRLVSGRASAVPISTTSLAWPSYAAPSTSNVFVLTGAAGTLTVASNAADANTVITIEGLSAAGAVITEDLTLTTTSETSANSYWRVYRAFVKTLPSGASFQANNNDITLTLGSNLLVTIPAGEGLGSASFYTVPASHDAFLRRLEISSYCNVYTCAHYTTVKLWHTLDSKTGANTTQTILVKSWKLIDEDKSIDFRVPLYLNAGSDLYVTATNDNDDASETVDFQVTMELVVAPTNI